MPACDALVVCCPAYLLSVAGRCNPIVRGRWTLPERTCNGRVDSVSPADFVLKKETLARVAADDKKTYIRTLAAAAELWLVANDIPHCH